MTRTAISPRFAIRIRRIYFLRGSAADVPTCLPFFEERAEPFLPLLRDTLGGDRLGRQPGRVGGPPCPDTRDECFRRRDRVRCPAEEFVHVQGRHRVELTDWNHGVNE